jgi:hypothetical protein
VLLQGFFTVFVSVRGVSFSRHRRCFSRPQRCHAHASTLVCVQCISKKCSHVSIPRAWPTQRDRGELSDLFARPFASLPRMEGRGVHDSHRAGCESWIPLRAVNR